MTTCRCDTIAQEFDSIGVIRTASRFISGIAVIVFALYLSICKHLTEKKIDGLILHLDFQLIFNSLGLNDAIHNIEVRRLKNKIATIRNRNRSTP